MPSSLHREEQEQELLLTVSAEVEDADDTEEANDRLTEPLLREQELLATLSAEMEDAEVGSSDLLLTEPLLQDQEQVGEEQEAAETEVTITTSNSRQRLESVDALRGLVIAVMILVDDAGPACNHAMDHSPWNGVTLADFVMPFFLFLVGVSVRLSYRNYGDRSHLLYHIFLRSSRLFALGFILQGGVNDFPTFYDLGTARVPGILQRIAFCYFVTALSHAYLAQQSATVQVLLPLVPMLLVYLLLVYLTPLDDAENCPNGRADLSIPCNAARRIDEWMFGSSHLYQHPVYIRSPECSSCSPGECTPVDEKPDWCDWPYDPEGVLPSLAAVGSTMLGLPCGSWLRRLQRQLGAEERRWILRQWMGYGACLGLIGLVAPIPWNKNLYTLTYAFFMGGCSVLSLLLCYLWLDVYRPTVDFFCCSWWVWLGTNAILVFVLGASGVLDRVLGAFFIGKPDHNLVDATLKKFQHVLGVDIGLICFVLVKIFFWVLVCGCLYRRKLFVKI